MTGNQRWRDVIIDGQVITVDVVSRFNAKVVQGEHGACWLWQGKPNNSGYGRLHVGGQDGRHILAHRLAYGIARGRPLSFVTKICHSCDNPPCVNPSHLFAGTQTQNMVDCKRKGRFARGVRHGTATKPESRAVGERHGGAKLQAPTVLAIRREYAAGKGSYGKIGKRFNVTPFTVRDIVKRRRWKHI
jgi:hypothetical protein